MGTNNSVASASKVDGFFKNPKIKIPWPTDAANAETKLRELGMGTQCDKVVETLNRGAEEAAKSAAPIFVESHYRSYNLRWNENIERLQRCRYTIFKNKYIARH